MAKEINIASCMTTREIEFYSSFLRKSKTVIEFGVGGSTKLALNNGVSKIYSIDSSKDWLEKVSNVSDISIAISDGRVNLIYQDIGPVKEWGYPINNSTFQKWPNYATGVFKLLGKNINEVDLVLIDGRFRMLCAMISLSVLPLNSIILIHDFERVYYQDILKYAIKIDQVDNLVAIKKDPESVVSSQFYIDLIDWCLDSR